LKPVRKIVLITIGVLTFLCISLAGFGAITNRSLPQPPAVLDRLHPIDAVRLEETLQLKSSLGDTIWPGWGEADIPILLWNNEYSFLFGVSDPPSDWEMVSDDRFMGQVYYRQPSDDPQNFAMPVGDVWAASLATKWEMDAFLLSMFRQMLPDFLEPVFPFLLIIQPTEVHISGVLHETFHVYQIIQAPDRLHAAEAAHRHTQKYRIPNAAMMEDWEAEISLLIQALSATSEEETREIAQEFVDQRRQRRSNQQLADEFVEYERWMEWLEGLAKYLELSIWREASETPEYIPIAGMSDDPDFKGYKSYTQRWNQEIDQLKRQAKGDSDVRFYYTGMAQAVLLDRLSPEWKKQVWQEGVWLETLLEEALQSQ
jgi:hypothetical protein